VTVDPRQAPARALVHGRLVAQVEELRRREAELRVAEPEVYAEAVHKARVACRRLRAALSTFGPLVDRRVTDPVRAELRWWGSVLGEARDTHVVRDRIRTLVADRPPADRAHVEATYDARERVAREAVLEALDSPRHAALARDLAAVAERPGWTGDAERPATDVLPGLVLRDWRRLRRSVRRLDRTPDRDGGLHRVRKDAKRLRYAAETLEPGWPEEAAALAAAATALQTHLGEHQDTVVARVHLHQLAVTAPDAGYADLVAREADRAARLEAGLAEVWQDLARRPLRAWLG
jgi:CHAD domain-containing protein